MTSILWQARLVASKEEKSSSHFYFMYPSTEGNRKDKRDKLGSFEHPTQVIAAGFDPTSEAAMHLGWEICSEFRKIPRLIQFRTF
jgi:hypothetical protein